MPTIRQLTHADPKQFEDLCALLIDAVEGGASVGFLSPLAMVTSADYWRSALASVPAGLGLFVAEEEGVIVGSVQLSPCSKENGRHRAEVQKLFVLRSHRSQGIASLLMQAAEELAVSQGKTLLVLDTHEGSQAEAIYEHLGWNKVGVVPDFAASPDGTLHGTVYFYKRLAPAGAPVGG